MADGIPRITDPKALRALAHPLRWKLLEIVGREGTATATECANQTGESVANCSYHLNMLAKYNYVQQAAGGHGREKPWQAVDMHISLNEEGMDTDGLLAARAATGAFFDYELTQIKERYETVHLEPPEWRAVLGLDNNYAFLTTEEVEELREAMRELIDKFSERRTNPRLRPEGARSVNFFVSATVAPKTD
jgi:Helix-turn-helix domain